MSILIVAVAVLGARGVDASPQETGPDLQGEAPDSRARADEGDREAASALASGAMAYRNLLAGLFRGGELGAVRTRPFEPTPRGLFKIGKGSFVGQWDEDLVHDDNVFLSAGNRRRDTILRSRFGLVTEMPFGGGDHRLVAGYQMERNRFLGGESRNFVEQFASGRLEMTFNRLKFHFGDRWEERTDPVLAVFTGKVDRDLNTVFGGASWEEDAWVTQLEGQQVATDYADVEFASFDRREERVTLEGRQRLGHGWWAQARLSRTGRTFDADELNDADGIAVAAGLRLQREGVIDASSFVGLRRERFSEVARTDTEDRALTPDVEVRSSFQLGLLSAIELDYHHASEFSAISNYQEMDRTELTYTRQLSSALQAWCGGALELVNPSVGESFRRYSIALDLRYVLAPNLHLAFDYTGRFRRGGGPDTDYDADTFSVGLHARF